MLEPIKPTNDPRSYSPLTLAFLGDAVFGLLVRQKLIEGGNRPVGTLHRESVRYVSASAQSQAVEMILPVLTEEETQIYKRGRNHSGHQPPRHTDPQDYRRATGLECLFGYLYLRQENERLCTLFDLIWNRINP